MKSSFCQHSVGIVDLTNLRDWLYSLANIARSKCEIQQNVRSERIWKSGQFEQQQASQRTFRKPA